MIRVLTAVCCLLLVPGWSCRAESVAECQQLLATGRYAECLTATSKAVEERSYGEEWPILKAQAEMALGKYPDALATIAAGIERYSWSVRLRQLEYECALANGKRDQAAAALIEIENQVSAASWRYTDADDLVALGQVALILGADPKNVQQGFFERARKNYSSRPEGYVAAARLALEKGDSAFAAELLSPAIELFPANADVHFLLSEAIGSTDEAKSSELLLKALELNPSHFEALGQVAEGHIIAESYSDAETVIQQLLNVNPDYPQAHALQAVIHHLRNDEPAADVSRTAALRFSGSDPRVDHRIGRILSQKYRFMEGAASQRRALEADSDFIPAKIQLAQDLLRLGNEAEGWQIAEEAHQKDGYDTTLFNLLQLKDSMDRFTVVSTEHFRIRMEKHEAAVYGPQVAVLLENAWAELIPRYEFTPELPVVVEIYSRADDFAVRTFGIPDVAGFLGVCFGKVVTANSPATRRESPTNWESILWHEFCHVITLQKTSNRIPRWLSEGISVYEERRRDSRWGQSMDAEFRDRILADKLTPIAELSSAFLSAKSGADLNFAYYESSMVVEHLVELHGLPALNAILTDVNTGLQLNDAIDRNTDGIEALEASFRTFILEQANAFSPGTEFSAEAFAEARPTSLDAVREFLSESPNSFPALLTEATLLIEAGQHQEAETSLRKLIERVPEDHQTNGPRRLLASLYRKQNQPVQEAKTLAEHLQRSADDLDAAIRLQELSESLGQPQQVVDMGRAIAGIDPFQIAAILRTLKAAEELKSTEVAVSQLNSLLLLQPDDAARFHFRIADFLKDTAPEKSRRHVLLALEQAPRYRNAHRLLLSISGSAADSENEAAFKAVEN
jgi:thioredoxin-like negative regulator of GroEL